MWRRPLFPAPYPLKGICACLVCFLIFTAAAVAAFLSPMLTPPERKAFRHLLRNVREEGLTGALKKAWGTP